jgi:hypothetical protein
MVGVLITLMFLGCDSRPRQETFDLPIYFSGDTKGRLEPCGCFTGQFGGLTRIKSMIEQPPVALRVDVGDAAAGHADYQWIQYGYMLRAFAMMGYQALNIGHREAGFTVAQLRELRRTSPVPVLSANLIDKSTGQRIFDAYRIIELGGFKIGVIGVLDPSGVELGEGLAVEGMESALSRVLQEVKGKVDYTVLLAFADEAALAHLAQQFFELSLILGGKVRQPSQELRKENRSYLFFVTNESRALGNLRVRLGRNTAPTILHSEIELVHEHIPQDAAIRQLAESYRDEIRRTRLALDDPNSADEQTIPGVRTAASYAGTAQCVSCHVSSAQTWTKTGHARAFETLQARRADADPHCLSCHTVGFGTASGYRREFKETKLVDVGCESCHGPGSLHVQQRKGDQSVQFKFRPLGAGDCKKCHYGEFSRPFDWDHFWPLIKHGRE